MLTLKEIVSGGTRAEFSHAIAGVLYYRVDVGDEAYMFPLDMNNSDDVGTSTFNVVREGHNDDEVREEGHRKQQPDKN